jgi:hypothetical protein
VACGVAARAQPRADLCGVRLLQRRVRQWRFAATPSVRVLTSPPTPHQARTDEHTDDTTQHGHRN